MSGFNALNRASREATTVAAGKGVLSLVIKELQSDPA